MNGLIGVGTGVSLLDGCGARAQVQELAASMQPLPKIEPAIAHLFCEGIYARPMLLEAGDCVVGKIHTHGQINVCSRGKVAVLTQRGLQIAEAGFHHVATAGAQRAFYALEESIWTVFLRTDLMTPEEIEAEFVVETELQYAEFVRRLTCHS